MSDGLYIMNVYIFEIKQKNKMGEIYGSKESIRFNGRDAGAGPPE